MARMRVFRSKHSINHRPDGHHNWQVEDRYDGTRLVFNTFHAAIEEADRLARCGLINPHGLVGCQAPQKWGPR